MQTLTERIKQFRGGVVDNPYQGKDKRVLFVCSAGILRSATAARLYAKKYNTRAAGSFLDMALVPLNEKLLYWADEIVFVNRENYNNACRDFPEVMPLVPTKVLNIPDTHEHMSPALVQAFKDQYEDI